MDNKEIAEWLRKLVVRSRNEGKHQTADHIEELADILDPPLPEPGTAVWWRYNAPEWAIGIVAEDIDGRVYMLSDGNSFMFSEIEWKPACIPGPRQVTATIPMTDEWPSDSKYCEVAIVFDKHDQSRRVQRVITRAEAEAMEDE